MPKNWREKEEGGDQADRAEGVLEAEAVGDGFVVGGDQQGVHQLVERRLLVVRPVRDRVPDNTHTHHTKSVS
eukprot:3476553-Rhodomonas_salina.1